MKKLLSLVLCVLLVAGVMAGCEGTENAGSGAAASGEVTYQDTITIGVNADMKTCDMQNTSSVIDRANGRLAMDLLVQYNSAEQKIVPDLATEWTQIDDTTWQFKLREGVKFHDGTEFDAEDVAFTFKRGKDQANSKSKLNTIDVVEIVDPLTINLKLTTADPDILSKLSDMVSVIYSKEAFETMDVENAVKIGTGPFKYVEWVQGSHVSFTAFDECWEGAPKTKNIVIKYIPEAPARLIALQTGEIDVAIEPPVTDFHYVEEDPSLTLYKMNGTNLRYVWLNINVEPFNNKLVRQAISYALDREEVVAIVYNGNATPCANIMHPDNEFYSAEATSYEFNIEKAKELLAEAGYPDGFECTIYCTTGNTQKSVATVVQSQLAKVGIKVNINAQESATFGEGVKHGGTYDMAVDGWGGYAAGVDAAVRPVFYSTGATNRCNIEDPKVDELIDSGLAAADYESRKAIYAEIQDYLMQEAVWVPFAVERINVATKSSVQGWTLPHGTTENYRYLYIEN